jgi:Na+/glutamate symporter
MRPFIIGAGLWFATNLVLLLAGAGWLALALATLGFVTAGLAGVAYTDRRR